MASNSKAVDGKPQSDERVRVLRISHASLTPALRQRERALVRNYPEIDLEVLTARRWREAEMDVDATTDDLFPVVRTSTHLSRHIQLFAYDPRSIMAALRRHRPHLIDLGHEPYSVACAEMLTLSSWFAPRTPVVMQTAQNIHHNYVPPFNWFEQRAFRRVSAAYVCSDTVREILRVKGFEKPVAIIPFGADLENFRPRTTPTDSDRPLTVGFVGRLLPEKGINLLIDALASIGDERWNLLIVGEGPEREAIQRRLVEKGLANRTTLAGGVRFDRISEHYRKMDVLVLPTQTTKRVREQFGRVLVEAMASGVPVIGSTCGAIPEVIGHAGLVFPEGDAEALGVALKLILSDHELRRRFARDGAARVRANYSWDRVADQTYQLFMRVLKANKKSVLNPSLEFAS
jgi:glycosyltransferase involved in cell wall biosynthesis